MTRTSGSSTRRAPTRCSTAAEAQAGAPGLSGMLRGSMNSVMGTVGGLNVPLRAVERLTGAIERSAALLERLERATRHLDKVDARFIDRLDDSFDVLAQMRQDTKAMRQRVDSLEKEVHGLHALLNERFDRVPLLRAGRRARKAAQVGGGET